MPLRVEGLTPLLEVFDMRRSVGFYRDVLGFEVVQVAEPDGHLNWAMLRLGGAVLMLNGRYEDDRRPPAPDAARAAGHADTELFFGYVDVDAAYAQVKGRGWAVEPPVTTHYGMRQVWLSDPDGFRICFQQRVK